MKRTLTAITLAAALAAPSLGHAQGIMNMDREEMLGSVIGASVGALLGSKVGDGDNELLGAALGGVGGYFAGKRYGDRNALRDNRQYGYQGGYDRPDNRYDGHQSNRRYDGYERDRARSNAPRIHAIDQPFRARVNSHVRTGPAPGYRSIDILRRGASVHVVGRVAGTDWFMVSRRGRVAGYVYAPLLQPENRHSQYGNNW